MATQEELIELSKEYLKNTDWLAIKSADTGISMNAAVKARRAEARAFIGETQHSLDTANEVASIMYGGDSFEVAIANLFDYKANKKTTAVVASNQE